MSMMNSFLTNAGGDREARYAEKAKAMFDDDGSGNTGIEIVRLNKKFDIFMKRFARAEEDIKEVKQNFYRVMHCAFAKYEQGFKRKNEFLEKRKMRRTNDIDKGVEVELKNRGFTGRIEDPLLSTVHGGGRTEATGRREEDDSLIAIGGMGLDEES
jgi:hypothetical protein